MPPHRLFAAIVKFFPIESELGVRVQGKVYGLGLILQTADRQHIHPILPLVCVLPYCRDYSHKGWQGHLALVYDICKSQHIGGSLINALLTTNLYLKQGIGAVTAMKHRVAFQAAAVPIDDMVAVPHS